jgi:hypothetical protein
LIRDEGAGGFFEVMKIDEDAVEWGEVLMVFFGREREKGEKKWKDQDEITR